MRVTFDWSEIGVHVLPEGMRVAFYPLEGGRPWVFDCPEGRDRIVEMPEGKYRVLCYSNDTEDIIWSNSGEYDKFTAGTASAEAPDGILNYLTPDWLCGDYGSDAIDLTDLPSGSETEVSFTPVPMVCTYTFEVNGIGGLQYISDIYGCLSDMSGALNMATDVLPEVLSDHLFFSGKADGEQIHGGFYTFGPGIHDPEHAEAHVFKLFLKSHKGNVYTLEADVTEQIHSVALEGHLHNVHLVVDFVSEVPEEPIGGGGGGFEPDVDEWEDENQDIIL